LQAAERFPEQQLLKEARASLRVRVRFLGAVRWGLLGGSCGAAAACALLALDRLGFIWLEWFHTLALTALSFLAGAVLGFLQPPSALVPARAADDRLGLKERVGTTLDMAGRAPSRRKETSPRQENALTALFRVVSILMVFAGLLSCSSARVKTEQPGLKPTAKPTTVALEEAQRKADFVIYIPTGLPSGCRLERILFVPVRESGEPALDSLPDQVYMEFSRGLAMWQMPVISLRLATEAPLVVRQGRSFWINKRGNRTLLEWVEQGTHIGLSAPLKSNELLRVALSVKPARPEIMPAERPIMQPAGIGVELRFTADRVIVQSLLRDSPAARGGIKPGDTLVAVDGLSLRGASPQQVVRRVRGKPGTKVRIALVRAGGRQRLEATVTRTLVPTPRAVARTIEALRREMPFRVLLPSGVLSRFQVAEVSRLVMKPNPEGMPVQARISWRAPANQGFQITEERYSGRRPTSLGHVVQGPHGMSLDWLQSGTLVHFESINFTPEELLRLARSLR
jgi:hypothetical protein